MEHRALVRGGSSHSDPANPLRQPPAEGALAEEKQRRSPAGAAPARSESDAVDPAGEWLPDGTRQSLLLPRASASEDPADRSPPRDNATRPADGPAGAVEEPGCKPPRKG